MLVKIGSDNKAYGVKSYRGHRKAKKGRYQYIHMVKARDNYTGYIYVGEMLFPASAVGKKIIIRIEEYKDV